MPNQFLCIESIDWRLSSLDLENWLKKYSRLLAFMEVCRLEERWSNETRRSKSEYPAEYSSGSNKNRDSYAYRKACNFQSLKSSRRPAAATFLRVAIIGSIESNAQLIKFQFYMEFQFQCDSQSEEWKVIRCQCQRAWSLQPVSMHQKLKCARCAFRLHHEGIRQDQMPLLTFSAKSIG